MKAMLRIAAGVACLASAFWAAGAGAQWAEPLPLLEGWYDGEKIAYYDLGSNSVLATEDTVATAPVWPLITGFDGEGNPQFVDGQHNIFDTVPGDPDYTDLWAVTFVTVPEDYEPDTIRSLFEIEASGYPIESAGMLRNCPIVPEGTALEGGEELHQGWVDGQPVSYFDFGVSAATIAPVWVFVHGFDAGGAPLLVEDQYNIFDSTPADEDYTAFRRVHYVTVPEDYEPDSIRSADDVLASGFPIEATDTVVNYPVVASEGAEGEAPTAPPPGSYIGAARDDDRSMRLLALVGVVIGAGLIATVGAFSIARRKG